MCGEKDGLASGIFSDLLPAAAGDGDERLMLTQQWNMKHNSFSNATICFAPTLLHRASECS